MTQGITVKGNRAKFGKEAIAAIKEDASTCYLEATSFFGNEYDGPMDKMPENKTVYIVGPDPYTKRSWYINVTRVGDKFIFNK